MPLSRLRTRSVTRNPPKTLPLGDIEAPPPPSTSTQRNSSTPDALDEVVWRVCRLLFRHIVAAHQGSSHPEEATHWKEVFGERVLPEQYFSIARAHFSEKLYVRKRFRLIYPLWISSMPPSILYRAKSLKHQSAFPKFSAIFQCMRRLCRRAQLSQECPIICLIYIERLMSLTDARLTASSWRPLVIAGLLLASKVWEDISCWNVEFTELCPDYTLRALNRLERTFCAFLDFKLHIDGDLYAAYYFDLRDLGAPPWRPQVVVPTRGVNGVDMRERRASRKRYGAERNPLSIRKTSEATTSTADPIAPRVGAKPSHGRGRRSSSQASARPAPLPVPSEDSLSTAQPSPAPSPPPIAMDVRRRLAEAETDDASRLRWVKQQLAGQTLPGPSSPSRDEMYLECDDGEDTESL